MGGRRRLMTNGQTVVLLIEVGLIALAALAMLVRRG